MLYYHNKYLLVFTRYEICQSNWQTPPWANPFALTNSFVSAFSSRHHYFVAAAAAPPFHLRTAACNRSVNIRILLLYWRLRNCTLPYLVVIVCTVHALHFLCIIYIYENTQNLTEYFQKYRFKKLLSNYDSFLIFYSIIFLEIKWFAASLTALILLQTDDSFLLTWATCPLWCLTLCQNASF